jgi:phosphoribosyl isomerase A
VQSVVFTLLPAVDVAGGQAVRLVQGQAGSETTHGAPRDAALVWQGCGAEWIHLVDLDAAFGRGSNAELLAELIGELDINVELSGGIQDEASLQHALSTDCARVVLATSALRDLGWCARAIAKHGERIAVGLDVSISADSNGSVQHRLAARGGTRDDGDLWATIALLNQADCARYIVTDVAADGMLNGPNIALYRAIADATSAQIVASGGVSSIADLISLTKMAAEIPTLEGSIIGKALYANRFSLPEALEAVRSFTTRT